MAEVIARQTFEHGSLKMRRGEEAEVSESIAAALEKVGLISRKAPPLKADSKSREGFHADAAESAAGKSDKTLRLPKKAGD